MTILVFTPNAGGKTALASEASPPVDQVFADGHVGYHNRAGAHSVEMFDWPRFLEFAVKHLKNPKTP